MTENTTKIIKIVLVIMALIGLSGIILACGNNSKESEAQATVKELVQLKDKKQKCRIGILMLFNDCFCTTFML